MANRRAATVGVEPQRGGQHGQLRGAQCAYRDQGAVGSEPGAHRAHLGDASLELLGEQADDEDQDGMDQPHPALDPAYRAREPDRVAAQRIGRRAHTRSPLGMRHHRFERIEFTGQPCSQTVRQQAEGGVALGAVPASDLRPARGNPTSPTQREFCRFSLFSTTQVIELLKSCTPNSPQYRL